ncbi:MAG: hypothetical protein CVV33_06840 [Methanomicrobiales archaeon HGW-Methanomicrobiales-4]|nr:MAG: hypothetical protein CVV33_06840 [Methanomicrobiales archaeon HGW-Methanomicrobiales-4]
MSFLVRIPLNNGVFLRSENRFEEALLYYDEIFSKDPGSGDLWVQRGQILEDLGLHDDAYDSYRQALEIDPGCQHARFALSSMGPRVKDADQLMQGRELDLFPASLREFYTSYERIGSDRTGIFYMVERVSDRSLHMVKILDSVYIRSPQLRLSVQVWHSLHHPNILGLSGWSDTIPYLEMEPLRGLVLDGRKIWSLIDLDVPIVPLSAVKVTIGICKGLSYLHHKDMYHTFLELSALFLHDDFQVKIGGFDVISTFYELEREVSCWILAPEQLESDTYGDPGARTDIFQTGSLLYYLLTGSYPYGGDVREACSIGKRWDDGTSEFILPSMGETELVLFASLFSHSLAIDQKDRYDSIEKMLKDLSSLESALDKGFKS